MQFKNSTWATVGDVLVAMSMTWREQRNRMREWALLWAMVGDKTYLRVAIYWRDLSLVSIASQHDL